MPTAATASTIHFAIHSTMKIAFFSTHSYDIEAMDSMAVKEGVKPTHEFV